ncbi:hypothetical protein HK101_005637 [Irineochytrium annulatum]|nr:hypothetical protein HK101_005637 [Irineochytrium annulatum]
MMRARTVFIARHGTREDFVSKTFISPTGVGLHDPPLADEGHRQAISLARELQARSKSNIRHIFCSTYSRCVQTITPLSVASGVPISIEPGLSEYFSADKSGLFPVPSMPTLEQLSLGLNLPISTPSTPKTSLGGTLDGTHVPVVPWGSTWETAEALHRRFAHTISSLLKRLDDANDDGDVVLVTHAAGVIAGARGVVGWDHAPVLAGVATFVELKGRLVDGAVGRVWDVIANGESGHLREHGGCKYVWGFSDAYADDGDFEALVRKGPYVVGRAGDAPRL